MSLYRYKCTICAQIAERMVNYEHRNDTVECSVCGGLATLCFGSIGSESTTEVYITTNQYTGTKAPENASKDIRVRAAQHKLSSQESMEFIEEHGLKRAHKSGYYDRQKSTKCI